MCSLIIYLQFNYKFRVKRKLSMCRLIIRVRLLTFHLMLCCTLAISAITLNTDLTNSSFSSMLGTWDCLIFVGQCSLKCPCGAFTHINTTNAFGSLYTSLERWGMFYVKRWSDGCSLKWHEIHFLEDHW